MKSSTIVSTFLFACLASALPTAIRVSAGELAHNELSITVARTPANKPAKAWDYGVAEKRGEEVEQTESISPQGWDYGKKRSDDDDQEVNANQAWDYGKEKRSDEGSNDDNGGGSDWDYGKRSADNDGEVNADQAWDYGKRGEDQNGKAKEQGKKHGGPEGWDYGKRSDDVATPDEAWDYGKKE